MNKKIIIVASIFILITLGISLFIFRGYIFANPAERTTMRFLSAIENQKFDTALTYVLPSERDKFMTSQKILETVSNIQDSNVQIKFSSLKYKTIKMDDKTAEVSVNGKLKYQFFDAAKQATFDRNFKLIKKGKAWYIKSLL